VTRVSSPILTANLRGREEHAKGWVLFRKKSVAESDSSPIMCVNFILNNEQKTSLTLRMSRTSTTRSQSLSPNLNADQGTCFTTRLLRRNVVIGPNISSADDKYKPIGLYLIKMKMKTK
jgi:hypothetical protein